MDLRLEEDRPSIVVAGAFDPRLLHPQWFRAEKLLGRQEADQANVTIVHPDITQWSTEAFVLSAFRDRLVVQATVGSSAEVIRDFVIGTLELLDKTPTGAIGLNRTMHFHVGTEDRWHQIGDRLVPKDLWRKHLPTRPGMGTLQVVETRRPDGLQGKVVVTVQPSVLYKPGVFFDVNNEILNTEPANPAFLVQIIRDHWGRLLGEARAMADDVLGGALQ
jgi:hypothetical protein